jgi:hypothetical protein
MYTIQWIPEGWLQFAIDNAAHGQPTMLFSQTREIPGERLVANDRRESDRFTTIDKIEALLKTIN